MDLTVRVVLIAFLCSSVTVFCNITHSSHHNVSTLIDVLSAAEWDSFIMLCDVRTSDVQASDVRTSYLLTNDMRTSVGRTSKCPADYILSIHPSVYVAMDLTNRSLIVQMFEAYAAPRRLDWLVFCADCEALLQEINAFEATHLLHGYLTHRYQWILVPDSDSALHSIKDNAWNISNVVLLSSDSVFSVMFGNKERYLQEIHYSGQRESRPDNARFFPNTRNGFNNKTMMMTVMPWATYVIIDGATYSGYYVELRQMIAASLNFTIRFTSPVDQKYGAVENGEWTGMVRMLQKKDADMAAVLTKTYDRSVVIDFLHTAVRNIYQSLIIYNKPGPSAMSLDVLLKPFSRDVWLAFVAVFLLTGLIFHFSLYAFGVPGKVQRQNGIEFILRSTLNQGANWSPRLPSSRIMYSVYNLSWIVLCSTYTGFLVSFLSVKKEVIPFRTADELAANNDYKLGLLGGGFVQDAILRYDYPQSNPGYYFKLKIERDMKEDPTVIDPEMEYHERRLLTEKYAMIGDTDVYMSLAAVSCNLALMDKKGRPSQDGFAFPKNSAYGEDVNAVLRAITEGELNLQIAKEHLPQEKRCSNSYEFVSLENIYGFFYILVGGVCLAGLALPLEIFIFHYHRTMTSG